MRMFWSFRLISESRGHWTCSTGVELQEVEEEKEEEKEDEDTEVRGQVVECRVHVMDHNDSPLLALLADLLQVLLQVVG